MLLIDTDSKLSVLLILPTLKYKYSVLGKHTYHAILFINSKVVPAPTVNAYKHTHTHAHKHTRTHTRAHAHTPVSYTHLTLPTNHRV